MLGYILKNIEAYILCFIMSIIYANPFAAYDIANELRLVEDNVLSMEFIGIAKEYIFHPGVGDFIYLYSAALQVSNNSDHKFLRGTFGLLEVFDGENWRDLPYSAGGTFEGIAIMPWANELVVVSIPANISLLYTSELYRVRMTVSQTRFDEYMQEAGSVRYDLVAEFFWPANDEFLTFPILQD